MVRYLTGAGYTEGTTIPLKESLNRQDGIKVKQIFNYFNSLLCIVQWMWAIFFES